MRSRPSETRSGSPDDVPLEIAAPFGCGIQTGRGRVLNALRPPAGASIAVFGMGTVGLAAVMAAVSPERTTIIGIDPRAARLELARELGATHVIDPGAADPVETIKKITGGVGADFAIDAAGLPQVVQQAVDSTGPGGVCCLVGAPPFGTELSRSTSTRCSPSGAPCAGSSRATVPDMFLPTLIELWRQGRFPVDRIMAYYDFDEIDRAARDAEEGRVIKPVLRIGGAG